MTNNNNLTFIFISYKISKVQNTSHVRLKGLLDAFAKRGTIYVYTKNEIFRDNAYIDVNSPSSTKKYFSETTKSTMPFTFAFKIVKSFPTNLVFSKTNLFYVIKAYRSVSKLVRENNNVYLFSSYSPIQDHLIAYLLKRKFPHVRWIADYRDLYIEPLYQDVFFPSFQKRIEQNILSKASIITTVSNGLVKHLSAYKRPTLNIMRGIRQRPLESQYPKFTISYTGSLYQQFRDPRPFFKVLSMMIGDGLIDVSTLRLLYAGKDGELFSEWVEEYSLTDIYENHGMISRDAALHIQNKSHINLLLTSSTAEWQGVLTGKVFEYIESGNATLCLIRGVKDVEFEELFSELNAGTVVYDPEQSSGKMREFILEKYDEWKTNGNVEQKVNFDKIEKEHSWTNRVDTILRALEEKEG